MTLINSIVGYVGYILAAFVIDLKGVGRMRLQSFGFFMNMLMFLICAAAYQQLTEPGEDHDTETELMILQGLTG